MIFSYDPTTNILQETSYEELSKLTGLNIPNLRRYKAKGAKISKYNLYITDENITQNQRKIWYGREVYDNEAWKNIHQSDYFISSYGRLKKKKGKYNDLVLPSLNSNGQLRYFLEVAGKKIVKTAAVLVAEYFLNKPKETDMRVFHKNRIKTDNYFLNLEYMSWGDIGRKNFEISRKKAVVEIDEKTFEIINEYPSVTEASQACFMDRRTMYRCCSGKISDVDGRKFMYEEEYLKISSEQVSKYEAI